jgi:hypothetical protein
MFFTLPYLIHFNQRKSRTRIRIKKSFLLLHNMTIKNMGRIRICDFNDRLEEFFFMFIVNIIMLLRKLLLFLLRVDRILKLKKLMNWIKSTESQSFATLMTAQKLNWNLVKSLFIQLLNFPLSDFHGSIFFQNQSTHGKRTEKQTLKYDLNSIKREKIYFNFPVKLSKCFCFSSKF